MKQGAFSLKCHPSLRMHKDVAEICGPLFKKLNYYIMNFIRLYDDGRLFYLCDNQAWLQYYLENGYPSVGAFEQNRDFRGKDHILWDALNESDPIVIFSRKMFNIKHGITLIRKFKGGYDFFNFGTTQAPRTTMDKMYSDIEVLNHFVDLFYSKTKGLLENTQLNTFQLSEFSTASQIILPNKYYLGPSYEYQYLTRKELICLRNLSEGMAVPEMANLCHVSPRTIEKHLENIKHKLKCKTQCELGYLIAKLGIDQAWIED